MEGEAMTDGENEAGQSSTYDFLTQERATQDRITTGRHVLQRVPLFAGLRPEQLDLVARLGNTQHVESGQVLVKEGEVGSELIVIDHGSVRIERKGQVVARLGSGDYVGEMALLDGLPRSATVIADEPSSLFVIQKHTFDHVLENNPELRAELLLTLVSRLRARESTPAD
jgi:CRP-like cAMP-binding protein